ATSARQNPNLRAALPGEDTNRHHGLLRRWVANRRRAEPASKRSATCPRDRVHPAECPKRRKRAADSVQNRARRNGGSCLHLVRQVDGPSTRQLVEELISCLSDPPSCVELGQQGGPDAFVPVADDRRRNDVDVKIRKLRLKLFEPPFRIVCDVADSDK